MVQKDGLTDTDALARIWCIDKPGLLMDDIAADEYIVSEMQQHYVKSKRDIQHWTIDDDKRQPQLLDVVRNVKPTILIGVSTKGGAFSEKIIRTMASNCDAPIIFPLSNPTRLAEAIPSDLLHWVKNGALKWNEAFCTNLPLEHRPMEKL
jgi:malate dehydrogenase (oxaloacetate-decarboxylating)